MKSRWARLGEAAQNAEVCPIDYCDGAGHTAPNTSVRRRWLRWTSYTVDSANPVPLRCPRRSASAPLGRPKQNGQKTYFSICMCHACARATLISSVPFQCYRMIREMNPKFKISKSNRQAHLPFWHPCSILDPNHAHTGVPT